MVRGCLGLLCLFIAGGMPSWAAELEPPRVQARAEIKWTKTICVEKDRYVGWPTVCRLQNGELLAVFSGDRDEHVCPYGKVQLIRSKDEGETWSSPVTIANGILDDRDAGVVQLPNGEVIVTWFTSIAYTSPGVVKKHPEFLRHHEKIPAEMVKANLGYYLIRSQDNGTTWSQPMKLVDCDQTPHGPIVLKDGSLLQIGRRTRKDVHAASRNTFDNPRTMATAGRICVRKSRARTERTIGRACFTNRMSRNWSMGHSSVLSAITARRGNMQRQEMATCRSHSRKTVVTPGPR